MTDPSKTPRLPHFSPRKSREEIAREITKDLSALQKSVGTKAGNWFQRFLHRPWTNPWRIFARDFRSITTNVMGMLVTIGLIIVPCLYAWFNIAGCWDVYANTGGLSVAVANTDRGYSSDLIPVKVNVGDELVNQLRANKQLGWRFVSQADAVDGVKSGRYYASIVIPKSFSADMMTLFSKDVRHAQLVYYVNQKESPLGPTVTGKGASTVRTQVNAAFASTITNVGLEVANTLGRFMESRNAQSAVANLSSNISDISRQTRATADLVGSYQAIIDSADGLLKSASSLLPQDSSLASQARKATGNVRKGARSATKTASSLAGALDSAVGSGADAFASISRSVKDLSSQASGMTDSTAASLDALARDVDPLESNHRRLASAASTLAQQVQTQIDAVDRAIDALASSPSDSQLQTELKAQQRDALTRVRRQLVTLHDQAQDLATRATTSADSLAASATALRDSARSLRTQSSDGKKERENLSRQIKQTGSDLAALKSSAAGRLNRQISSLSSAISRTGSSAVSIAETLDSTLSSVSSLSGSTSSQLSAARTALGHTRTKLTSGADRLDSLTRRFTQALQSKDVQTLKALTRQSPSQLASIVAAPIAMHRHAVYPVKYFGEQMTPFYAILALWVGSTLLAASSKSVVSRIKRRGLIRLRQHQLYFGRYLFVLFVALIQGTMLGLGCLFFLKVQSVEPWLFMLTYWASALVFSNFIYTMGYVFGVIGKAICVFFMIVEISGSNGMYPVEMMPGFFATVRPWLPATYAMSALRESIAGVYGNEWAWDILHLLAFMVPMLLIGLLLYKPFQKVFRGFERQTAAANLMGIA